MLTVNKLRKVLEKYKQKSLFTLTMTGYNQEKLNTPGHNSGLKLLPALDYRRIISTSNEHFTNRANSFPNFGNCSSPRNVMQKIVVQKFGIFQNSIYFCGILKQ